MKRLKITKPHLANLKAAQKAFFSRDPRIVKAAEESDLWEQWLTEQEFMKQLPSDFDHRRKQ